ncbi:uncharacterized protein TNCV_3510291 [Trichonephila clavipes]|nr:uncharacterized protein TNCV_3510291 [Trichonephila clavipes]
MATTLVSMKKFKLTIYRLSSNVVFNLRGEIENIVKSQNFTGKHGRKAIGGAIRKLARSARVCFSRLRHRQHTININNYSNTELVDIHFIYRITNGNGDAAVRLNRKRYVARQQLNHQNFSGASELGGKFDISEQRLKVLGGSEQHKHP